jgi:hypothetical protein
LGSREYPDKSIFLDDLRRIWEIGPVIESETPIYDPFDKTKNPLEEGGLERQISMQKWEYMTIVQVYDDVEATHSWQDDETVMSDAVERLNALGEEGWELAGVDRTVTEGIALRQFFLKRPIR